MSKQSSMEKQTPSTEETTEITPSATEEQKAEQQPEYTTSPGLFKLLKKLNVSIAFTSYQSGLLYFIGRSPSGTINVHQTRLAKPMGLSLDKKGSLTVAGRHQIMRFDNILKPGQMVNKTFDTCFAPRQIHVTGFLDAHDVGTDNNDQPVFVNTRFNCVAMTTRLHSFKELWRPPFISMLVDEDRCHLNGMAMHEGKPRYTTAVSMSDTIDGWRDRRSDGGIVIDLQTNNIVCKGLSMPHSPRLHNDQLWLLNSGTGELGTVDFTDDGQGQFVPKVFCPGFTRGLAFYDKYAFVGLSKPRYKRFEGLALDDKLKQADSEPWCGVQIIDLEKNSCVAWFRIDGNIAELFDVEVIPESVCPMAASPDSKEAAELVTFTSEPSLE